jgi:excisionase family DNA binding protein
LSRFFIDLHLNGARGFCDARHSSEKMHEVVWRLVMSVTAAEIGQRYFDYPAAARYTGMSPSTIRRLHETGRLHAYKPTGARKTLFDKQELDDLIRKSAVVAG